MDIHHHLAYGVDDGPKSCKQMQKMLKYAEEEGIGAIVATPHATPMRDRTAPIRNVPPKSPL